MRAKMARSDQFPASSIKAPESLDDREGDERSASKAEQVRTAAAMNRSPLKPATGETEGRQDEQGQHDDEGAGARIAVLVVDPDSARIARRGAKDQPGRRWRSR